MTAIQDCSTSLIRLSAFTKIHYSAIELKRPGLDTAKDHTKLYSFLDSYAHTIEQIRRHGSLIAPEYGPLRLWFFADSHENAEALAEQGSSQVQDWKPEPLASGSVSTHILMKGLTPEIKDPVPESNSFPTPHLLCHLFVTALLDLHVHQAHESLTTLRHQPGELELKPSRLIVGVLEDYLVYTVESSGYEARSPRCSLGHREIETIRRQGQAIILEPTQQVAIVSRVRVYVGLATTALQLRIAVSVWLRSHGYRIQSIDNESAWITVKISPHGLPNVDPEMLLEWPLELCTAIGPELKQVPPGLDRQKPGNEDAVESTFHKSEAPHTQPRSSIMTHKQQNDGSFTRGFPATGLEEWITSPGASPGEQESAAPKALVINPSPSDREPAHFTPNSNSFDGAFVRTPQPHPDQPTAGALETLRMTSSEDSQHNSNQRDAAEAVGVTDDDFDFFDESPPQLNVGIQKPTAGSVDAKAVHDQSTNKTSEEIIVDSQSLHPAELVVDSSASPQSNLVTKQEGIADSHRFRSKFLESRTNHNANDMDHVSGSVIRDRIPEHGSALTKQNAADGKYASGRFSYQSMSNSSKGQKAALAYQARGRSSFIPTLHPKSTKDNSKEPNLPVLRDATSYSSESSSADTDEETMTDGDDGGFAVKPSPVKLRQNDDFYQMLRAEKKPSPVSFGSSSDRKIPDSTPVSVNKLLHHLEHFRWSSASKPPQIPDPKGEKKLQLSRDLHHARSTILHKDKIEIAQLVAEQALCCLDRYMAPTDHTERDILSYYPPFAETFGGDASLEPWDPAMVNFSDLMVATDEADDKDMELLDSPLMRISRQSSYWDLLPSAEPFWTVLGLAPTSGPKDVAIYSILSDAPGIRKAFSSFENQIRSAYMSNRFGSLRVGQSGENSDEQTAVVKYCEDSEQTVAAYGNAFKEMAATLANASGNVVLFVLDILDIQRVTLALFSEFYALRRKVSGEQNENVSTNITLHLRLIKPSTFFSPQGPRILSPTEASKIARQLYDDFPRAAAPTSNDLIIAADASIELAPPMPQSIQFTLSTDPPASLLKQDSVMHLAYATSSDDQWLTAAWTDSTGSNQTSLSYSLTGRSFDDIARDIWDATLEIIAPRRVNWRIFVVSTRTPTRRHVKTWTDLFSAKEPPPSIQLTTTLLSINTRPPFRILAPRAPISPQAAGAQPTPAPTPGTQAPTPPTLASSPVVIGSPAAVADAPTPAAAPPAGASDADPAARLIDITDTSWSVCLRSQLRFASTEDSQPALASGLLVKRGGASEFDDPVFNMVDLVHMGRRTLAGEHRKDADGDEVMGEDGPTEEEKHRATMLLKEVVRMYRDLALLARVRGLEGVKSTRPWHVAVAETAVKGLEEWM